MNLLILFWMQYSTAPTADPLRPLIIPASHASPQIWLLLPDEVQAHARPALSPSLPLSLSPSLPLCLYACLPVWLQDLYGLQGLALSGSLPKALCLWLSGYKGCMRLRLPYTRSRPLSLSRCVAACLFASYKACLCAS
jgi:hypothetical protein